jgi:hypothetical protein
MKTAVFSHVFQLVYMDCNENICVFTGFLGFQTMESWLISTIPNKTPKVAVWKLWKSWKTHENTTVFIGLHINKLDHLRRQTYFHWFSYKIASGGEKYLYTPMCWTKNLRIVNATSATGHTEAAEDKGMKDSRFGSRHREWSRGTPYGLHPSSTSLICFISLLLVILRLPLLLTTTTRCHSNSSLELVLALMPTLALILALALELVLLLALLLALALVQAQTLVRAPATY